MRLRVTVLSLVLIALFARGVSAQSPPLLDSEALNLGFEKTTDETHRFPSGWRTSGHGYDVGVDAMTRHGGTFALVIRSVAPAPNSFGVVTTSVAATMVAGKRVRYSGWIRRQDVDGYVGLWFRADVAGTARALDNMQRRSLRGSHDWEWVSLTIDVPADADRVLFGALLSGDGAMWVDDLQIEILGPAANPVPGIALAGAGGVVLFLASFLVLVRKRMGRSTARAFMYAAGIAIAVVGASIALWAPSAWFDLVLARLIGGGGTADTTAAQRAIAATGALIAALGLARWGGYSKSALPLGATWRVWIAAIPFGLLMIQNLGYAGAAFHLWSWPRGIPEAAMTVTAALLSVGCVLVISKRVRISEERAPRGLLFATACGAGYGCFSALWHCCAPLWQTSTTSGVIDSNIWFVALALSLGAVGRLAARWSAPKGELIGAVLFACFYPWHTPAWFAQCLLAGAFSTWMVRLTGSGWAPAAFLATTYASHMSLPFIGWAGAAIAAGLLFVHVVAARPDISGRTRAAPV